MTTITPHSSIWSDVYSVLVYIVNTEVLFCFRQVLKRIFWDPADSEYRLVNNVGTINTLPTRANLCLLILVVSWTGLKIISETNLWVWLGGCLQWGLTVTGNSAWLWLAPFYGCWYWSEKSEEMSKAQPFFTLLPGGIQDMAAYFIFLLSQLEQIS